MTITEIQKNCSEYYTQNKEFISIIILIILSASFLRPLLDKMFKFKK